MGVIYGSKDQDPKVDVDGQKAVYVLHVTILVTLSRVFFRILVFNAVTWNQTSTFQVLGWLDLWIVLAFVFGTYYIPRAMRQVW